MPQFSQLSRDRLSQAHVDLQTVFYKVVASYDCSVLVGFRDKDAQEAAFKAGRSSLHWPQSTHNSSPARGIDVSPYPVRWSEGRRFYHFAGFVQGVAQQLGIGLRWGGDWDGDLDFSDQQLQDLVHYELK